MLLVVLVLAALSLSFTEAACCKQRLTYHVNTVGGAYNYNFDSNYGKYDTESEGLNASIAVIAGCPVDFVLDGTTLSIHPFDLQNADGTPVTGFNQGQTSGTQSWMVPSSTTAMYKYVCQNHPSMTNTIRVIDACDAWDAQLCTDYCTNVSTTCTGSLAQFPNPDSTYNLCMNSCKTYPGNASLATGGDSLQCRLYHLSVAAQSQSNAVAHCNHTGFNGGPGVCGEFCDAYCDNILSACNDTTTQVYPDRDTCMQECSYFPRNWNFDLSSNSVPTDNSVDCRSWHSQVASNSLGIAQAHCPHASPAGGGLCGGSTSTCNNYCDNVMAACTGTLKQWNSWDECAMACASWSGLTFYNVPQMYSMPWANNSLPCRKYHAFVAGKSASNANTHCVHTGPLGGSGVCGSECEGLCSILLHACGNPVPMDTCINMCNSNLTQSSSVTTADILMAKVPKKSVGCATYYAVKALSNMTICSMLMDGSIGSGSDCEGVAAFLQASWMVILAAILLALGFTSN